ncbi:HdeD family acid-resistance protein [Thermocoleostomius sinensis]|uniref:HdeD family acid-resistance protein n=1 Tax=Thermocoleostomius sinensis A174 TaxID=2016057 RepID=A0A9E8ZCY1_9CYAN|nr:HdeD family acid-resistance protein [Thermocoleostomius sinensis]WAL60970.1 HdeD family acid-resistance protein [Thermocoleostomius sinensis A174]
MNTETINEVRRSLGWLIALGVVMVMLGITAIVEPFIASIVVARVLSWTFLLAGIVRILHALQSRRQRGFWLKLLIGMFYMVASVLLLSNMLGAKLTLTLVFGWTILIQGMVEIITALKIRSEPGWGLMVFSGIVALILGILILNRWPNNAIWLLGFFTGVSFIFTGIWMIMLPRAISNHFAAN